MTSRWGALLGALALLVPASAHADVEVESESVYRSYSTPGLDAEDVALQPFSQSFRLTAAEHFDLTRIAFETYFRGVGDNSPRSPGFEQDSRVYYAYVDVGYGRRNPIDLRLGRQPLTAGGDLIAFDGGRFRYRGPMHLGFELYGGTTVSGVGAVVPLGLEDGGATMAGGAAGGATLFLTGVPGTDARLGFRHIERDGGVDREDVVANFARRIGRTRVYGDGELSTVLGILEEGELGASIYSGRATFVDVEGFHYTPSFGARSIFNVFNVDPYDEGRVRVRSTLAQGRIGVWARLGHQVFEGGGESADNLTLGSSARMGEHAMATVRGYVSSGWQGSRNGGAADLRYRVMDNRVMILAGVTAASAKTDILANQDGTYLSFLGGLSYTVPDRADLSLLAEQYADPVSGGGAPRVSASFRFKFGAGVARRTALDPNRREVRP